VFVEYEVCLRGNKIMTKYIVCKGTVRYSAHHRVLKVCMVSSELSKEAWSDVPSISSPAK